MADYKDLDTGALPPPPCALDTPELNAIVANVEQRAQQLFGQPCSRMQYLTAFKQLLAEGVIKATRHVAHGANVL